MNDDKQDLAELLRSDARRIRETEDFDPRLHQDTMRAIRQIESGDKRERGFIWSPLKVSATAVIAMIACVWGLWPGQSPVRPKVHPGPEIVLAPSPTPGSAFAYRQALIEGEDALLTMLDQDARVVLPRSADMFQSNRGAPD